MSEVDLSWKVIPVFSGLIILLIAERLCAKERWPDQPARHKRLFSNAGLWLLNAAMAPLIVMPMTLLATQYAWMWRPEWWAGWSGLLLDIVVLDAAIYGWHRANHRVAFLWRFHRIHHLDEFLDVTSAVRFHFGEVILSAVARAVFILLVGFPLLSVVVFEVLVLLIPAFSHSNLRLPAAVERVVSMFIVTPSIHWVHHHAVSEHTDSNYATILSFWDKLFGSRSAWQREPAMKIGVANEHELSFRELLTAPFQKK